MKRLARWGAAACLLVLAGIAIGALVHIHVRVKVQHRPLAPAQVAPAIACPGVKATMNCVLQHQAPPASTAQVLHTPIPSSTLSLGTTTASESAAGAAIYGVDFGWGTMSASGLRAIGARFAASYLSPDASKNWTRSAVIADHAAGIATVAVWEGQATEAQSGYGQGVSDAQAARAQAAALGDTTEGIDFAVDCDCSVASVTPYFRGVHAVLGTRAGIYGGYQQVMGIHALGLVGNTNWATYAWSDGLFPPASIAPLEQYLNGNAFDNDRAIAGYYGQWPRPAAPKPKPKPKTVCFGRHAQNTRKCRTARADVKRWQSAAAASTRVSRSRRCPSSEHQLAVLDQRWDWFHAQLRQHPRVKHASREAALHATSAAIHVKRRYIARERCSVFDQRIRWFDAQITATQRRLS